MNIMTIITGAKLLMNGEVEIFEYNRTTPMEEYISENKRGDTFIQLECFYANNMCWRLFGYISGNQFNRHELNNCNPCGDVLVIQYNILSGLREDIDYYLFNELYTYEDILDDFLLADELHRVEEEYEPADSYDYGNFVIRDNNTIEYFDNIYNQVILLEEDWQQFSDDG